MIAVNRDRLRALITERKTSARAISLSVGSNSTLVRDILSGASKNPRVDKLSQIAEQLGVPLADIMLGEDRPPDAATILALAYLPIRGTVQAGAWLESDAMDQGPPETYPAAPDPRFPLSSQWLSVVRGDSMNALERDGHPAGLYDGDLVHCVDAVAIEYQPRTGDIVEVERIRNDGADRELTVKQVEVTGSGILLWPRSTNGRWSGPIHYQDGDAAEVEVRIRGWVIGSLRRF